MICYGTGNQVNNEKFNTYTANVQEFWQKKMSDDCLTCLFWENTYLRVISNWFYINDVSNKDENFSLNYNLDGGIKASDKYKYQ